MTDAKAALGALDAIRLRRAVRSYETDAPSDEAIHSLLEAAVHAPTAMHREPWAFVVVQERALLRRLSDRVKAQWRTAAPTVEPHVLAALPEARGFMEALARPDFNVFYDASTLIIVGARPLTRFVEADCWLAAENMMIAACAMGLGTCVIGAAIDTLDSPGVKLELGIPAEVVVVAPIIVGVPRGAAPPTSRRAPEILAWRR